MKERPSPSQPEDDHPERLVFAVFWMIYGFALGMGLGWLIWA
jgi:hypothetical protein